MKIIYFLHGILILLREYKDCSIHKKIFIYKSHSESLYNFFNSWDWWYLGGWISNWYVSVVMSNNFNNKL